MPPKKISLSLKSSEVKDEKSEFATESEIDVLSNSETESPNRVSIVKKQTLSELSPKKFSVKKVSSRAPSRKKFSSPVPTLMLSDSISKLSDNSSTQTEADRIFQISSQTKESASEEVVKNGINTSPFSRKTGDHSKENLPWIEKFRPQDLSELISHDEKKLKRANLS